MNTVLHLFRLYLVTCHKALCAASVLWIKLCRVNKCSSKLFKGVSLREERLFQIKTFCCPAKRPFFMASSLAPFASPSPPFPYQPCLTPHLLPDWSYSILLGNLDKLCSDCSCVPFPRLLVQSVPSSPDCLWKRGRHGQPHNSYLSDSLTGPLCASLCLHQLKSETAVIGCDHELASCIATWCLSTLPQY